MLGSVSLLFLWSGRMEDTIARARAMSVKWGAWTLLGRSNTAGTKDPKVLDQLKELKNKHFFAGSEIAKHFSSNLLASIDAALSKRGKAASSSTAPPPGSSAPEGASAAEPRADSGNGKAPSKRARAQPASTGRGSRANAKRQA